MPRFAKRAWIVVVAFTLGCHPAPVKALVAGAPHVGRLARVEQLGRLVASKARVKSGVTMRVSGRGGLGAWAWPSGKIEVTADLIDALDDEELVAALAHEIAHLRPDASSTAALAEEPTHSEAVERAADRDGCAILREIGFPGDAMVSMLRKVSAGLRNPAALDGRIAAAALSCGVSSPAS